MSFDTTDHLMNPELIRMARETLYKSAFIPGGDPSMGGGGGGDPAAGGGGDPAAGGGGGPPPGGGGGGGMDPAAMQQMVQQAVQQAMMAQGGGGGAGAGAGAKGLTPKIDEKAVMLQILKILARIADHLKIPIPASEMVVNQSDMMGLAQASQSGGPMPGMDPSVQGGDPTGGGGGAIGGMPGMDPMQGAGTPGGEKMGSARRQYRANGVAFDTSGFADVSNKAEAVMRVWSRG